MPLQQKFILPPSCRDRPGIGHAVSGLLFEAGRNIINTQQFGDLREAQHQTRLHALRWHVEHRLLMNGPKTAATL